MGNAIGNAALGIGTGAVNSAIGMGLGLLTQRHEDRRQVNQQKKLTAIQEEANKREAQFSSDLQYDMWQKTNYPAQVKMLEEAGLNPALIYGIGGGGGTTTGSANAGAVSGGTAQRGEEQLKGMGIQQASMQQAMELSLLKAQKENIEADTANKEAQATKTSGVDTTKTQTEIQSLTQGISNQKSIQELTEIESELKKVDLGFNKATYNDRLDYITQEAREMTGKASQALIQANLDTDARQTRLNTIKAEYIQRLLENALITAKTKGEYQAISESQSNIKVNDQKIQQIAQGILMDWDKLSNDNQRLRLQQVMTDYNTDPSNEVLEGLSRGIGNVLTLPFAGVASGSGNNTTPIRGFHKRK